MGTGTPGRGVGMIPTVDIPILRELPAQGTTVGLKPMGATVAYLRRKNPDWGLSPYELLGRLKSLQFLELVVRIDIVPSGRGKGWQRTKAGDHILDNAEKILRETAP